MDLHVPQGRGHLKVLAKSQAALKMREPGKAVRGCVRSHWARPGSVRRIAALEAALALRGRAEHENGLIIPGFGGSSSSLSTRYFTSWPELLEHLTGRSSPLLQCELPLFFRGLRPEHRAHRDIEGRVPGSLGSPADSDGPAERSRQVRSLRWSWRHGRDL